MMIMFAVLILCTLLSPGITRRGSVKKDRVDVLNHIKSHSIPEVIPLWGSEPLAMLLTHTLVSFQIPFNTGNVELTLWQPTSWSVAAFRFNSKHNGLQKIVVPSSMLWTPDIVFYNALSTSEIIFSPRASVYGNGTVLYMPSYKVLVPCNLNNIYREEGATCLLIAASWMYDSLELKLSTSANVTLALEEVQPHDYEIFDVRQEIVSKKKSCCDISYDELHLKFTIRHKSLRT